MIAQMKCCDTIEVRKALSVKSILIIGCITSED